MWLGVENIEGKTILVCADEGLGDTIQFVRYAPMLAALGARVILLPQESLYPLLSGLPGVAQCLPNLDRGLPAFDVHCPIMSLPLAFRTTLETIPAPTSYLPTPAEDRRQVWEDRLGQHDRLRVGMVWSGNPKHKNDHNRSIPLRTFSSILVADASFVSLQKGSKVRRQGNPARANRHCRPDRASHRFHGDGGPHQLPRSGDHGGYQRGPSRRRARAPHLDVAALHSRLALVARS
jgi:hypothetical protein